jgi:hypothetical protein
VCHRALQDTQGTRYGGLDQICGSMNMHQLTLRGQGSHGEIEIADARHLGLRLLLEGAMPYARLRQHPSPLRQRRRPNQVAMDE